MTKKVGSGRQIKKGSTEDKKRLKDIENLIKEGRHELLYSGEKGGYVMMEKSEKQHSAEEIEVAKILADKGYKVILKDETECTFINIKGIPKVVDGYLYNYTYEQKTPLNKKVEGVLKHAMDKNADIALIYDKYGIYNRQKVEQGIRNYEYMYLDKHRFVEIIVVSKNGNIHVHRHNK